MNNLLAPPESPSIVDQPSAPDTHGRRLAVLDGWRAVSIILVLCCHMLPLGFKDYSLNYGVGLAGMALFFTLSGFLITSTLCRHPSVPSFLIRRLFRIVPLSFAATLIYLTILKKTAPFYFDTIFYLVNYHLDHQTVLTSPYWSLCVEVHFYLFTALICLILKDRGLLLLPFVGLAITAMRINQGTIAGLETHLRADEIMAGASLALIWFDRMGRFGRFLRSIMRLLPTPVWAVLFAASCFEVFLPLEYLRPYLAALLVGRTLFDEAGSHPVLTSRSMRYIAEISFSLYIVHKLSMYGWLGTGGTLVRYTKRVASIALTFGLAHLVTFHFERHFTALGKRLSRRWDHTPTPPSTVSPVADGRLEVATSV
jgi:peptidoglycan/LPS O-acetylase OafA/YrhL